MKRLLFSFVIASHCAFSQGSLKVIVPLGHTRPVTALAISPDDKLILSGAEDNLIKLWNAETGKLLKTYKGLNAAIAALHVSNTGKYFLALSSERLGLIMDVASGDVLDSCLVNYNSEVVTGAGGDLFMWRDKDNKVNTWSPETRLRKLDPKTVYHRMLLSPDNKFLLALGSNDPDYAYYYDYSFGAPLSATLINVRTGTTKLLRKVKGASGNQLGFSKDGSTAYVGDDGNTVLAFSTATGLQTGAAPDVIWTDDFSVLASGVIRLQCYDGVRVWDPVKKSMQRIAAEADAENTLKFLGAVISKKEYDSISPLVSTYVLEQIHPVPGDPSRYAIDAGALYYNEDLKSAYSTRLAYTLPTDRPVYFYGNKAALFNDKTRIVTASSNSIRIVNSVTGAVEKVLRGLDLHSPRSVAFSDDDSKLAYSDTRVHLWNFAQGKALHIEADSGTTVVFGKNKTLLLGTQGKLEVRSEENGRLLHTISGNASSPFGLIDNIQISPDEKYLLWSSDSGAYTKKVMWEDFSYYPDFRPLNQTLGVSYATKEIYNTKHFPGLCRFGFGPTSGEVYATSQIDYSVFHSVTILRPEKEKLRKNEFIEYPTSVSVIAESQVEARRPLKLTISQDERYAITLSKYPKGYGEHEPILYFTDMSAANPFSIGYSGTWWRMDHIAFDNPGFSSSAMRFKIYPVTAEFHPGSEWFAVGDKKSQVRTFAISSEFTEGKPFVGHTDRVVSMDFSSDGKWLATASLDNTVKLWDVATRQEIATLITFGEGEWVVLHPSGLFDASPGAMSEIYFSSGVQTIGLEQIKERFFEPNLLRKIVTGEALRSVSGLDKIDLFPRIQTTLDSMGARLKVRLADQGGGIGKTSLFINGKEAIEDIRSLAAVGASKSKGEVVIDIDLSTNRNLVWGDVNYIGVKSYNVGGYLASPVERIYYTAPQKKEMLAAYAPHLYALVVGVSDYENDELDLKYSSKDAVDFHAALSMASKRLFQDRVHFTLISSDGADETKKPTRKNIIQALESIAAVAQPSDLLVVYFSGHGTNQGGDDGDFLYLTAEARGFSFSDPAIRQASSISSSELTDHLKSILARKQVLIFDACASGRVVENMLAKRDVPSSTLRALERLKDRAGTYILTGCAADAVSYEATQFGQGLLTYSLLSGMRGAALRENRFVDVLKLFNYSKEEVPRLAENVGGIQEPKVFSPYGGESFDLGLLEPSDRSQIPLTEAKPFFVRSSFQNETKMRDDLGVGRIVDEGLTELANQGKNAPIIFLDAFEFPGAYFVSGRYKNEANGFSVKLIVFKNDTQVATLEKSFPVFDGDKLKRELLDTIVQHLPNH